MWSALGWCGDEHRSFSAFSFFHWCLISIRHLVFSQAVLSPHRQRSRLRSTPQCTPVLTLNYFFFFFFFFFFNIIIFITFFVIFVLSSVYWNSIHVSLNSYSLPFHSA